MKKLSAGILVYRQKGSELEVLLVHPGGPFWAKKDQAAWSIPKGEYEEGEEPIIAAHREFEEEIGQLAPEGEYLSLGESQRKDGKVINVWAVSGDLDISRIESSTFDMEWPPKSGRKQTFPEVDRAEWFELGEAASKLHDAQTVFLDRLVEKLAVNSPALPTQQRLL